MLLQHPPPIISSLCTLSFKDLFVICNYFINLFISFSLFPSKLQERISSVCIQIVPGPNRATGMFINFLVTKMKEEGRKKAIPVPPRMECFLALGQRVCPSLLAVSVPWDTFHFYAWVLLVPVPIADSAPMTEMWPVTIVPVCHWDLLTSLNLLLELPVGSSMALGLCSYPPSPMGSIESYSH